MRCFLAICTITALLVVSSVFAQIPISTSGNLLVGAIYNDGLNSSDICLVIQLEADGDIVVDEGDPVRYFFNKTPNNLQGEDDWMNFDYDDSEWSDGVNSVGYNSCQITAVPDNDDQGAIYSRFEKFKIPRAASITTMTIRLDYDDSFIIWLNEVEVVRANMRTDGLPEWNHDAGGHESTNIQGPNPARWDAPVSNLIVNQGDDNPNGSIVVHTFDVVFDPKAVDPTRAVELTGKVTTLWGAIKEAR